ncbi:MAG: hypothetical protein LBL45_03105 [Treponema sp.]|jgi:hypothetical protein|nr:hypothetical protein [Treponema sp.]
MRLAPHVEFDEYKHEYWYKGRRLSGVTGLISKKLGLKMPQEFVEEHQEEGIHVHRAVRKWIETGDPESAHPGVKWLAETFARNPETGEPERPTHLYQTAYSEVLDNTEILQAEMELPLRLCDEGEEERLELWLKKAHVVMINFRRNMTVRSVAERSQGSHTYNTELP